jgi:methylglyoxal synthase
MKVCDVHDVPLATNRASAEILLDRVAELVGDQPAAISTTPASAVATPAV